MGRAIVLILGLLGGAAAAEPASAPVTLAWQWPLDRARTWRVETALALPEPLLLQSSGAAEAKVDQLALRLVTRCSANDESPRGWTLLCELQDVAILGRLAREEQGDLAAVLAEDDAKLTGAWVTAQLRRDGRLDALDLSGPLPKDRRDTAILEVLRRLLERAFLGLELSLPPGAETSWSEQGAGLMSYLPRAGSLGAGRLSHEARLEADGLHVQSQGLSVSRASSLRAAATRGAPGDLSLTLAMEGEAVVDPAIGALLSRRWAVVGRVTPSTLLTDRVIAGDYLQAGRLTLLAAGEVVDLGPTGLWGDDEAGGEAWQALQEARPRLEARLGGPPLNFDP